ncbi:MAG TPA: HAD-IA family hydrolase [Bryobacteraceae bacterium]|nr:HAD-IA family hydrolase [Bryobacteraceae bacterium]
MNQNNSIQTTRPALLFDFDGVLADTEPLHFECWRDILLTKGIHLDWDYYKTKCIGISDRQTLHTLGQRGPVHYSADELMSLYPLKKKLFRDRAEQTALISPELKRALTYCNNYEMAVVTSSGKAEIEPILLREGVMPLLSAVVYGNEVKALKPDPEPYRTAMERLGVTSAIAFEDSEAGVASARAAGCEVVEVKHASEVPDLIRGVLAENRVNDPDRAREQRNHGQHVTFE